MRHVVAFCLVLGMAARADACDTGYQRSDTSGPDFLAALAGLTAPAIDLGFTLHDTTVERSSHGSAIAELLLTAPPSIVLGVWALDNAGDSGRSGLATMAGALALWGAALSTHAIVTLARDDPEPEPGKRYDAPASWAWAPTVVGDGLSVGAGLGAAGRF